MADQQNGEMPRFLQMRHRIEEELQTVPVHAADGLVQNEQIRGGMKRQRKEHPLQFPSGTAAQRRVRQILRADVRKRFPDLLPGLLSDAEPDRTPGHGRGHKITHGKRHLGIEGKMLGNIAGGQMGKTAARAVHVADDAGMWNLSEKGADQGGLPGAVLSDEDRQLAAVYVHGNVLEKDLSAAADGDPVQVDMTQVAAVRTHRDPSLKNRK